ncbi:MAG: prenyltransferase/squalene oxidase repeat-containing protein [bacterium]|nr:prenyltransferase/squalene oxidase repeat-containing protein [bacterium]
MRRFSPLIILYLSFIAFLASPTNAQTTFNLRIEGSTQTYFDGPVSIDACVITDSAGKEHIYAKSAACGVLEAANKNHFDYSFQDYGFGLFLTKIGTDDTPTDFSKSWGFWLNDDSASMGLDSYAPNANDNILLAYSSYPGVPLRVTIPSDAKVGQPITIKIEKRTGTTDANYVWHGTWEPAVGATLHINKLSLIIPESGTLTATLSDTSNDMWADGEGFVRSTHTLIAEAGPQPTPTETPSPTPSPTSTPSPTPSPTPTPSPETIDRIATAKKALTFLRDHQENDGSIEGITTSIWSAIAFGANEDRGETIKRDGASLLSSLLKTKPESATDIERLILALRATGQNPRNYQGIDYVQLLKTKYHDNQFGETTLLNDDIFGILALLAADEPANSSYLNDSISTLLKKQNSNGGWENIDLTAATIQALRRYKQNDGDVNIDNNIDKAKKYLKDNQDSNGGFGENSATTAWGIQAIIALNEDPTDWNKSNKNPITALVSYQNSNGGFGWKTKDDVSAFMTAYAIPALLYTPLPVTKLRVTTSNTVASPSPTPATTPSASPKIINPIINVNATPTIIPATAPLTRKNNSSKTGRVAGAEIIATPTPSTTVAPTPVQPAQKQKENNSAFMLGLSFTNIGIGVALTRLIGKLRPMF